MWESSVGSFLGDTNEKYLICNSYSVPLHPHTNRWEFPFSLHISDCATAREASSQFSALSTHPFHQELCFQESPGCTQLFCHCDRGLIAWPHLSFQPLSPCTVRQQSWPWGRGCELQRCKPCHCWAVEPKLAWASSRLLLVRKMPVGFLLLVARSTGNGKAGIAVWFGCPTCSSCWGGLISYW